MKKIIVLFICLQSAFTFAQAPAIQWQKSLGGAGTDYANSIQQTTDGGYIVAGYSNSTDGDVTGNHGGTDAWIIKLDASSNITWQRSYGGTGSDQVHSIQQTTDGGYIVAGQSNSTDGDVTGNHGGYDTWIVKLDAVGNIIWQRSHGGSASDNSRSIHQTTDGGYIVAGDSQSNDGDVTGNHGGNDYWIVKLNTSGNITWQKSLGGTGIDATYSIQQTTDGGYIVAGYSNSTNGDVMGNHGGYDFWVIKLDVSGNTSWQKSMGGTLSDFPEGYQAIQQTSDGGYIVAGQSESNDGDVTGNHGGGDYWIVKLESNCSPVINTITETACESFTWTNGNGNTYTSSTTAIHTIVGGAVNGCDSIVTLNLTINQPTTHIITATACESYTLNSQTYTSSGTYTQTLTNANNCDSTITLNLTINQPSTHTITATACESYTLNSQTYTSSGTYTQTLTSANNCDSTITLNLTINQPSTHTITATACESYTLNAQTYTSSGTYTQTLTNANNCDSTITLNLTINQPTSHTITETACESYTLNGQTYTSSGTYTQTLTNVNNCDSTITLNLTINNVDVTVSVSGTTLTANQGGAIYQWINCDNNGAVPGATSQSFTPAANGNYAVEVTANGCTDTSGCIVINSVGIKTLENISLNVFPNPSDDGIYTITSAHDIQDVTIEILTLSGQLVHKGTYSGDNIVINLKDQPDGTYIFKINNGQVFRVVKF